MKSEHISDALDMLDDNMLEHTRLLREKRKRVKIYREKICGAVACLCILCAAAAAVPLALRPVSGQNESRNQEAAAEQEAQNPPISSRPFVSVSSLLADNSTVSEQTTQMTMMCSTVPIGQYMGLYEKTASVQSDILAESIGSEAADTEGWFLISGHTDLQYLIQNDSGEYSLWKFLCFDSSEYPYSDVLKLVYCIDSADGIAEIEVSPPKMDNTVNGRKIQEEIGTHTITDRDSIEAFYEILSAMTCYGENYWDRIDYGAEDAAADTGFSSGDAVRLGRYLSLVTTYGNEIDGLKYTAVSDMFYEFSGIAYGRLNKDQAQRVREILGITETGETNQSPKSTGTGSDSSTESPSGENTEICLLEISNTNAGAEDINELQSKISAAMQNRELPFVTSSCVYENPYRLHITVTSDSESDLQKLTALDTLGGVLEIIYAPGSAIQPE